MTRPEDQDSLARDVAKLVEACREFGELLIVRPFNAFARAFLRAWDVDAMIRELGWLVVMLAPVAMFVILAEAFGWHP